MRFVSTIFFCLFNYILFAQFVKINGEVTDSIGNPIEFASIIAMVDSSGLSESYALTNSKGQFQLDLKRGVSYVLKASFFGFNTEEKSIIIQKSTKELILKFELVESITSLQGVEVVHEMPVKISGDTITYAVDAFNRGDERKLGDVLENLPGLEVTESGDVKVEGKVVRKVMIEGKDFFDGDSKLATKNIPADAIDKVEVLKNYNEIEQLKGVADNEESIAINIKLKEGKKKFWFGEVTAGAGVDDSLNARYLAHPKLFYYSPKYSVNIISDANNIGEVPFTWQDYFKFTGGFKNLGNPGGSMVLTDDLLNFSMMKKNEAASNVSDFLAGNFSWTINKKWNLSGFAIFSGNEVSSISSTTKQYNTSEEIEQLDKLNQQESQLNMLKLSSRYKPNADFQLNYDLLIRSSNQLETGQNVSSFGSSQNSITEDNAYKPKSINQNLTAYYTRGKNHIFSGQIQHLYKEEDPFYRLIIDIMPFSTILPLTAQNSYDLSQNRRKTTNKLETQLDYYYIINKKSNLKWTVGQSWSTQGLLSSLSQLQDNGKEVDVIKTKEESGARAIENDVSHDFLDNYVGMRYKFIKGKFTFSQGAKLHNFRINNIQLKTQNRIENWSILPEVLVLWKLKNSESFRLNYSMSTNYEGINSYSNSYVLRGYNQLAGGNQNLRSATYHRVSINYSNFSSYRHAMINIMASYDKKIEGVKRVSEILAINTVTNMINIPKNSPDETLQSSVFFNKKINNVRLEGNFGVYYLQLYNILNEQIRKSTSLTQSFDISGRSLYKKWFNIQVGYNLNNNKYDNSGFKQTTFTHKPYVKLDLKFLKHLKFNSSWDLYNYSNKEKTVLNTYSFWNAKLYYKKKSSKWEYCIQSNNILNVKEINSDSFSEQFNSIHQFRVLPRINMLVIKYDI